MFANSSASLDVLINITFLFYVSNLILEVIQCWKWISFNLIDLGAVQYLCWLFFTIYGMITPCDIIFLKFGHMDWFVCESIQLIPQNLNSFNLCSQIWTYGLIIWWIERVSIHHWITSIRHLNIYDFVGKYAQHTLRKFCWYNEVNIATSAFYQALLLFSFPEFNQPIQLNFDRKLTEAMIYTGLSRFCWECTSAFQR